MLVYQVLCCLHQCTNQIAAVGYISHTSQITPWGCILHQSDSLTWENQERSWKYTYILQVLEAKDQQIKLLQQQLVSKLTYLFHLPDSNITSPYCLQYIFWVALRMCCWIKQNPPFFMTHIATYTLLLKKMWPKILYEGHRLWHEQGQSLWHEQGYTKTYGPESCELKEE